MQIVITSTDDRLLLDGVPVRRWEGRTQGGVSCDVYIHRLACGPEADEAAFAAELQETAMPALLLPDGPPSEDPRWEAYRTTMQQHGTHPVVLTMLLVDVMMVVGTVQLALRHPAFPRRLRAEVEAWLESMLDHLAVQLPIVGEVGRLGNDPAYDVPMPPEEG